MKKAAQIYRFFSALTLILFLSSIVLPTSLSAASLLCGMDMSVMNNGTLSCEIHGAGQSEATILQDKNSCNYQQVCVQALSDSPTSIEVVPQPGQDFTVIFVAGNISPGFFDSFKPSVFQSEQVASKAAPPLFLLNSVFLN